MLSVALITFSLNVSAKVKDEPKRKDKAEFKCPVAVFPGQQPLYLCRVEPDKKKGKKACIHKAFYKRMATSAFQFAALEPIQTSLEALSEPAESPAAPHGNNRYRYIVEPAFCH